MSEMVVPDGWEVKRLGGLFNIKIGGTPSRNNSLYWDKTKDTENRWVSIKDLKTKLIEDTTEHLSEEGVNNSNVKLIQKGTVLMSFKLTVGRVAIAGRDLYTNEAIASFVPLGFGSVDRDYLFQGLQSWNLLEEVDQAVKGVTLNKEKLSNIVGLFPPLPEQQKIASILTSVDEVIEKTQSQINKLQDLKKGTMNELLTKGIGHTEFKDSPVGKIPVGWDIVELGSLCGFTQGVQIPLSDTLRKETDGYIRYLYINDFSSDKKLRFVRNEFSEKIVTTKDLVMANTGHTAGSVFRGKHGVLSNNAFKISVNEKIIPEYLYYYLTTDDYWIQIGRLFNSAGQPHVGHGNIAKLNFLCPSIYEQSEVVNILFSIEQNIEEKQRKLEQTQSLKKSLMQDLLTGKVRVTVN